MRSCEELEENPPIVKAKMPNPVLPKGIVSPSLLAFIMNNKYTLGLPPLYRQEQEFSRIGIPVNRQNMANWVIYGANH